MDTLQVSHDKGRTWESYRCGKASVAHQFVGSGHAITQIAALDMEEMPEEAERVHVRVKRANGELQPVRPLTCSIVYHQLPNAVVCDGRNVKQTL